jgi:hypothetical protein
VTKNVAKKQVPVIGMWIVRRHKRKALKASLFAIRHRRAIALAVATGRGVARATQAARAQPDVVPETKKAVRELQRAALRAREIGPRAALADARVAKQLSRAANHIGKAAVAARRAERRRRILARSAAFGVGVGILAAGAVATKRRFPSTA